MGQGGGGTASYLGSFSFLHANTVKALDEVVQHLCLFACFNGEAVAGRFTGCPPSTRTKTAKRGKVKRKKKRAN